MRALLMVLLALAGCATVNGHLMLRPTWWPAEEHGGASGRPAPSDVLFVGIGAAVDAGLQLTHVKPIPRVLADVTTALLVRTWRPLGRTEGSHFTLLVGVSLAEFVGVVARGHP